MKVLLSCLVVFFTLNSAFAQEPEVWKKFEDPKTGLHGYKDSTGQIKIPAKYLSTAKGSDFRSIIPVMEKISPDSIIAYYLLKNGKKVGLDSVYIWDNDFDCEQENKIRFQDKVTTQVGFFNSAGTVIIPAVYNDVRPFYNGLAKAIKGAKRVCLEDSEANKNKPENCEHWSWQGGKTLLINDKNETLIEFAAADDAIDLDWYSLEISDSKPQSKNRTIFKGVNGKFYSFINTEAEFEDWFHNEFLPNNLTEAALKNFLFDEIAVSDNFKNIVWKNFNKADFHSRYHKDLLKRFSLIKSKKVNALTISESLNPFILAGPVFENFYNYCGDHNNEKFPSFEILLNHEKNGELKYQESFQFIRTKAGYKLILIALGK